MEDTKAKNSFHFVVENLPLEGYPVMEQIRRDAKLCDVVLKVSIDEKEGRK